MDSLNITKLYTGRINSQDSWINVYDTLSTGQTQYVIEIPDFGNGSYFISCYNNTTDPEHDNDLLFGLYIQKVGETLNITYGRKSISIDEIKFADNNKILIKTKYGRRLQYSYNVSNIDEDHFIMVYDEYPDYVYTTTYKCEKDHANIYTSWDGIDLLTGETALGNAYLFLNKTNDINEAAATTKYNPIGENVNFAFYTPNQNLNKDDNVSFESITLPIENGKWLYSEDGKIVGRDLDAYFATHEAVTKEANKRLAEDTSLLNKINNVSTDVNTKIETATKNATAAIETVNTSLKADYTTKIDNEITARKEQDSSLLNKINVLTNTVTANKTSIENALSATENNLQTNINTNANNLMSYKTSNDKEITAIKQRLDTLEKDVADIKTAIQFIQSNYVTTDTEQTITANKTFSGLVTFNNYGPVIPTTEPLNSTQTGALWYQES